MSGAQRSIEPAQFALEELLIQKQQRAQRLVLGGSGHVMLRSKIGEEIGNLPLTEFARVTFAVEENETADPIQKACSVRRL